MQVEVTFTCSDGHEPAWFNSWSCPVCDARASDLDELEDLLCCMEHKDVEDS